MGKDRAYDSNPDWIYSGDVNAAYGGIWIRHYGDYADAVRICDLDSGCGFRGAVLIESISTSLPRPLSEAKRRVKTALECCGQTVADLADMSRDRRRARIWDALISYGYCDIDESRGEILQLESDGPMHFEGWIAKRKQPRGDVGGYVMAAYLD